MKDISYFQPVLKISPHSYHSKIKVLLIFPDRYLSNLSILPVIVIIRTIDFRNTKLPLIIFIELTKCSRGFLLLGKSEGIQGRGLVWAALHTYLGSGAAENCTQRQALSGVMEEDVGFFLVFSPAADLAPAVAREHQLLRVSAHEAEDADPDPASDENEEQEDAEDIRAGPVLGDVVAWVVFAHNLRDFEMLLDYHSGHGINAYKRMTK